MRSRWFGLAVALTLAAGCDDGGGPTPGEDAGPGPSDPPPAVTDSLTTDGRGGALAITDPDSPAWGTTVHVRPGARTSEIALTVRAIEVPQPNRSVLAGPVVEIAPTEDYLTAIDADLYDRTEVVMPVHDGPTAQVQLGRWDAVREEWRLVAMSQLVFADPAAQLGPQIIGRIVQGGIYAPIFTASNSFGVISHVHTDYVVEVVASRSTTEAALGFPFRTAAPGEVRMTSDPLRSSVPLDLPHGEYVLRIEGPAGEDPRCVVVTVPFSGFLEIDATTPSCDGLPEAAMELSSQLVRVGEPVTITARATSPSGDPLDWFLNDTGGALDVASGTATSGGTVTAEWTSNRAGVFEITFTAYDAMGRFDEARIPVRVRGNDPPEITSFLATPVQLGTGLPEGSRGSIAPMSGPDADMGLSLLTVEATDPDGDPISYFWYHGLPGNYYDPATGTQLGRNFPDGLVTDPATELPFTGDSVLYMAAPAEFLCDSRVPPLGLWLGLHVTASDGESVDRSWAMVGATCSEPATGDAFDRCLYDDPSTGNMQCFHYDSSAPGAANGATDCLPMGGDWAPGRCPSGGSACVSLVSGMYEFAQVYYDSGDAAAAMGRCSSTWVSDWGG